MEMDSPVSTGASSSNDSRGQQDDKRDKNTNDNDNNSHAASNKTDSDSDSSPVLVRPPVVLPPTIPTFHNHNTNQKPKKTMQLLGAFRASPYISRLIVLKGSVVDFGGTRNFDNVPRTCAIVNAANQGCLGGGGVDGAINQAGGRRLEQARSNLPILETTPEGQPIRCRTGHAVLTGPNVYKDLHVPYVIHAVGPNYFDYDTEDETAKAHPLLRSAYQSSLDLAYEHDIQCVGFSLLSAGIFKGPILTLKQVLEIGLEGIALWKPKDVDGVDGVDGVVAATAAAAAVVEKGKDEEKEKGDTKMDQEQETKQDNNTNAENEAEKDANPSNDKKQDANDETTKERTAMEQDKNERNDKAFPDVFLCGFTASECNTLLELCNEKFEKIEVS